MPKLQAAVPAGAPPNALLRVRLPDGAEVNVRVPEGLKPGDEFIFEVDSIGQITTHGGRSGGPTPTVTGHKTTAGKKGDGGGGKLSRSSKNPKKKRNCHTSGSGGDHASLNHHRGGGDPSSHHQPNNSAPSFVTGFFNMYNQVYDILSSNNTPPPPSYSRQNSGGRRSSHHPSKSNANDGGGGRPAPSSAAPPSPPWISPRHRDAHATTTVAPAYPPLPHCGILDRDLTGLKDFLTALAVGAFISASIMGGFLAGVLWVTPVAGRGDHHLMLATTMAVG